MKVGPGIIIIPQNFLEMVKVFVCLPYLLKENFIGTILYQINGTILEIIQIMFMGRLHFPHL